LEREKEPSVKKTLIFVAALLLTAGLAWAEEPAPGTASPDASFLASLAPAAPTPQDGGCAMPDLAGLSADEKEAALLAAGFEQAPVNAAVPACPTSFSCTSIHNCGVGPACTLNDIGPCCSPGGGLVRCCISGSIKVTICPCQCTGNPCSFTCVNSSNKTSACL
jgi:hypothetical protein